MSKTTRQYGRWTSPLTAAAVAAGRRIDGVAFDSDGSTDLAEYNAGTDPTDDDSDDHSRQDREDSDDVPKGKFRLLSGCRRPGVGNAL